MVLRRSPFSPGFLAAAMLVLGACSPAGRALDNSQTTSAHAVPVPGRAAPPCTPERLSCGLQQPVVSDGIHPFVNEEMGLTAIFPRGNRVCMGRSGDAARGFYAWQGSRVEGCPERGDLPLSRMSIDSNFNVLDYRAVREGVGDCQPVSAEIVRRLGGKALAFPGHRSIACQDELGNGMIEIWVHALAGTPREGSDVRVPRVVYRASLSTRSDRLDGDLAMFQTFLGQMRIGVRD